MTHEVRDAVGAVGIDQDDRRLQVLVLGALAVEFDGRPLHVAGSHRRRLLAFLASRPGGLVPGDAIVDALWGEDPPPSATKTIQSHVMRLRRSLAEVGGDVLETVPTGYRLNITPSAVDAVRFEQLVAKGRRELDLGNEMSAVATLADALALWRGPPYVEFREAGFAVAEGVRLNELRLAAIEDQAQAQLSTGGAASAVAELERLVVEEPGRERAWVLLMRALYASGRQPHALAAFRRARRALVHEFGLEPGAELQALERQIYDHDPALATSAVRSTVPQALRTPTHLVGRDAELTALRQTWRIALRGAGRMSVLFGAVDSGRTRLAGELAAEVVGTGGWVDYVRGADGFGSLVLTDGEPKLPGAIVDAVTERCRRGPLLLVVDDAEWMPPSAVDALEALASAAEQLTILVLLIADPTGGGPAIEALRHLPGTVGSTIGALADEDVARIVAADGVDGDAASIIVALSGGLPGVARREAASWAERQASDDLQAATTSAIGAVAASDVARATVFDEVLRLVAARTRRNELVSASWAGRQPYRALASYGPEDADLFVGRERLLAELAARMLDRRLVAVVGASGSGKSSLVRAGLIPLVRSGRLPGLAPWRTHVIVPGDRPLATLDGIVELDEPGPQLLVIDQFEEAFGGDTASAFAGRLVDLALDAALDVHVVVVVRADQYAVLATNRRLAELVDDAQVLVGPPTDDELRRIIEVPARRTGCAVEPTLVTLIADDVAGHEALPLVSAALAEVWERRDGDTLRAARYLEIGGIAAAVERLGARAIERAGGGSIRDVMLRLVDVTEDGQWTRRRIRAAEVPPVLAPALDALVDERLVVRDDDTVDVVHEVVFRAWPQLATWLEEVRVHLVLDRELRAAARDWDTRGRRDDDVLRGARLATASEFAAQQLDVPVMVSDFVHAGAALAEREHEQTNVQLTREVRSRRRLSRALAAAAILLVLALVGGILAVGSQRRADDERRQAEDERDGAQVARLVAESERQLDAHLDRALLLAVEAYRRDDNPDTQGALLTALTRNMTSERDRFGSSSLDEGGFAAPLRSNSSFLGFLAGPARQQFDVDSSTDGRVVASAGLASNVPGEGMTIVFDSVRRTEIGRIESASMFLGVDVSDDGRFVLAFDHFQVHLFDTASRTAAVLPVASPGATSIADVDDGATSIAEVIFRPSGDEFLVITSDGELTLWNRAALTPVDARLPGAPTGYVGPRGAAANGLLAFEPDGTLSVVYQQDGDMSLLFWDVDRGEVARTVQLEFPGIDVTDVAVSADGALLAGAHSSGQAFVWDLATGRLRGDPAVRPGGVRGIAFHPSSPTTLALGNAGGGITLYDVSTERPLGSALRGHGSGIQNLAFSADGRYLLSVADDGLIGIWGDNRIGGLVAHQLVADVDIPESSADGNRVLVRIDGDRLQVRDGDDLQSPGVEIMPPQGAELFADWQTYAMSADGSTVVAWTGPASPTVFVADAATGRTIWASSNTGWGSTWASLSPDGSQLVVVDEAYKRMRLWDLTTGQPAGDATIADIDDDVDGSIFNGRPQFSLDGEYIDVATFHGVARFSATDLRPVRLTTTTFNLMGDVDHVPGTDDVIAAGIGGQIGRWDMSTGDLIATGRSRESSSLWDVAVSPDGMLVAAGHIYSHELAMFDASTLRPLGEPFAVGVMLFTPQFTPEGMIGNGLFNDITLWDMDPASWRETACFAAGRDLTREEWAEFISAEEPYRRTCS